MPPREVYRIVEALLIANGVAFIHLSDSEPRIWIVQGLQGQGGRGPQLRNDATQVTLAEAKAQAAQLDKLKTAAEDKYLALDPYGVVEYSMAAKVRFGDIQYGAAQKIADAPIPVPVAKSGNDEVIATYETQRDANLKKRLDEAKLQWTEVYDLAKKGGISNRWSRKALENLGRMTRGFLYLEAITARDIDEICDPKKTDLRVHARTGEWYRKRLARRFDAVGCGLFYAKDGPLAFYELERCGESSNG